MSIIRHGDVILTKTMLPQEVEKEFTGKKFTIALGEATGHHHVAVAEKPFEVFLKDGVRYLKFDFPTRIEHEEHKPLIVQPGVYRQDQEREYDWFQDTQRKVID